MKIEDLTPYDYLYHNESVKSIGWLEGDHPKGEIDIKVIDLLEQYPTKNRCRGWHCCEYCGEPVKGNRIAVPTGNGEIWTVGKDGQVYAAPNLLVHYIEGHGYLPPWEFIDSVLNGIKPGTTEYEKVIKEADANKEAKKQKTYKEIMEDIAEMGAIELSKSIDKQIVKDLMDKRNKK